MKDWGTRKVSRQKGDIMRVIKRGNMKPKFDMNRVCFAWNFSGWGNKFASVMYDVEKGKYIELLKTESNFSLFRVEDIKHAFNKLVKKYPTEEKLLQYWQDNFSGWKGE